MDIKIIGAGPGGLVTGLKLLEAGFRPTIIEKQKGIVSTLCAEGLSKETLSRVPFGPWDSYAAHSFKHATFIFPSGQKAYVQKPCYTMDRTSWFRAMAKAFEEKGGKLVLGENIDEKKFSELKYDVLVDATGPLSWISRRVVGNTMKIKPGVQYRMKIDYDYDGMEFFLDKRYSDEYSWIFMKGETANVGLLGSLKQLDAFIADKKLKGTIIRKEAYNIPFFGTKMQEGNVLLMGDAAGITNPLTKGGMACCIFAAEVLVQCVKDGKVGDYDRRLKAHPVLAKEYETALEYFMQMDNAVLDRIGDMVDGEDLTHMSAGLKAKLLAYALLNRRKMTTLMKAVSYCNKYSW
ncbi:MAG: NAD(P)/FAD-dependent oxidoreductase [Candidatus Aenigmarchaeota archaeon]|nr:NAD(P)/FAD-dependent oxidoreductase [Candidatus Aenigmarchaeota archaeon]